MSKWIKFNPRRVYRAPVLPRYWQDYRRGDENCPEDLYTRTVNYIKARIEREQATTVNPVVVHLWPLKLKAHQTQAFKFRQRLVDAFWRNPKVRFVDIDPDEWLVGGKL